MLLVLGVNGLTPLEVAILVLFVSLFAWIALALISSVCRLRLAMLAAASAAPGDVPSDPLPRTALLMPAYNEQPARIMAALAVIHADLARLGAGAAFDLFILSDTTDPDAWIAEEAAFLALRERMRRRPTSSTAAGPRTSERKAGNIADWVRRWGGAYPQFLILDADSVMTGECIVGAGRRDGSGRRTPG